MEFAIVVISGQSEAVDAVVSIHVKFIVEKMDVWNFGEFGSEVGREFGAVAIIAATNGGAEVWLFVVVIVVADADADRCDFAELSKPAIKAVALGGAADAVEVVDKVARNCDEGRGLMFGEIERATHVGGNAAAVMNVA